MFRAFDKNNQFYIRVSNGRFSFNWDPDDLSDDVLAEGKWSTPQSSIESDATKYAKAKYGTDGAFYRHFHLYQEMNPGPSMSGVGGGKKSQISGCDFGVSKNAWTITTHEMGHALDLAHAEMWTNTEKSQITMKVFAMLCHVRMVCVAMRSSSVVVAGCFMHQALSCVALCPGVPPDPDSSSALSFRIPARPPESRTRLIKTTGPSWATGWISQRWTR